VEFNGSSQRLLGVLERLGVDVACESRERREVRCCASVQDGEDQRGVADVLGILVVAA
jgi:hypothetical protein